MHGAHTLAQGDVRFIGGVSANFSLGNSADAVNAATAEPIATDQDQPSETYTRGALAVASIAPGMTPFVAGRVGLGYDAEGGLTYTGRSIRVDARWALQNESWALSLGGGGSALLARRGVQSDVGIAGLNLEGTSGWGLDIPVVFGWKSAANLLWWWTGIRAGHERLLGQVGYEAPNSLALDGDIEGQRTFLTGLMGAAIGFRHLHAGIELQGGYHWAKGKLWGTEVDVTGATIVPAAALMGKF